MEKPFRIYQFLTGLTDACNYHRMILPARYCVGKLREEGINLLCTDRWPGEDDFDAFVWHGITAPWERTVANCSHWQLTGKLVNWSLDDDYRCVPSWNPFVVSDAMRNLGEWAANACNRINCSTRTLQDIFAGRPGVASLTPNMLEMNLYKPLPRSDGKIKIAYAGSVTHDEDMRQIIEAVTTTLENHPQVEFWFLGTIHPEIRMRHLHQGVHYEPPCPFNQYCDWVATIAPDIWLCPLVDCPFNQSKSNLKVLEGMAVGAAVIASDVEPYRDTITTAFDGLLVNPENPQEWAEAIDMLVRDSEVRKTLAQAGNELVNARYNWHNEACLEPWLAYYRQIREDARSFGVV